MSSTTTTSRQLPCGAEIVDGGVDFRVWAPERATVHVVFVDAAGNALARQVDGRRTEWLFFRSRSMTPRTATSTTFNWTTIRSSIPIRHRTFNRTACTARRR